MLDDKIRYGSRVFEIAGVRYIVEKLDVDIEPNSCPCGMTGSATLQYDTARPHIGDTFETEIESKIVRFKITSVGLLESLYYYYTVRISFAQIEE